jgi:hypothetical protein
MVQDVGVVPLLVSRVVMRWGSRVRHWCWGFSPFWFEQRGGAEQGAEEQCAQGQEGLAAAAPVPSPSSFPSFSPFLSTGGDELGFSPHGCDGGQEKDGEADFIGAR